METENDNRKIVSQNLKAVLKKIPKEIKETYSIGTNEDDLTIHEPAYINIQSPVVCVQNDHTVTLHNELVRVSLRKTHKRMHVTVFSRKAGRWSNEL